MMKKCWQLILILVMSNIYGCNSNIEDATKPKGNPDLACDFAAINDKCVTTPHITSVAAKACASGAPILNPPVGGTAKIAVDFTTKSYSIICEPHCGDGTTKSIESVSALFQATDKPLIELFCLDKLNIQAGANFFGRYSSTAIPGTPNGIRYERSVAFLVNGVVDIAGVFDFSGLGVNSDPTGGIAGAGGYNGGGRVSPFDGEGSCGGKRGDNRYSFRQSSRYRRWRRR